MAKFKKDGKRETPAISTASLPDIVFMLLFFFMVSTTMREVSLMVANAMPQATETVKLEKKSLVSNIYVFSAEICKFLPCAGMHPYIWKIVCLF